MIDTPVFLVLPMTLTLETDLEGVKVLKQHNKISVIGGLLLTS